MQQLGLFAGAIFVIWFLIDDFMPGTDSKKTTKRYGKSSGLGIGTALAPILYVAFRATEETARGIGKLRDSVRDRRSPRHNTAYTGGDNKKSKRHRLKKLLHSPLQTIKDIRRDRKQQREWKNLRSISDDASHDNIQSKKSTWSRKIRRLRNNLKRPDAYDTKDEQKKHGRRENQDESKRRMLLRSIKSNQAGKVSRRYHTDETVNESSEKESRNIRRHRDERENATKEKQSGAWKKMFPSKSRRGAGGTRAWKIRNTGDTQHVADECMQQDTANRLVHDENMPEERDIMQHLRSIGWQTRKSINCRTRAPQAHIRRKA